MPNFFSCAFSTAGYNNLEVAEYLLEHGADVNAQDKGGLIPLHNAASYGVGAGSLAMSRTARDSLKSYPNQIFCSCFAVNTVQVLMKNLSG